MKRIPKIGDWIKLPPWEDFYEVSSVDTRVHVHVRKQEFIPEDTIVSYPLKEAWIFRNSEKPTLDLSKPVQTRRGEPVRILCTDAELISPVIGLVQGTVQRLSSWSLTGRYVSAYESPSDLINVPPKPVEREVYVFMHQNKQGHVFTVVHEKDWRPRENKLLAIKKFTITEGEGI